MNRFEQDEKDAGVHQIHLIDGGHESSQWNSVEHEISWCSFYVFSKIFGLLCLLTALTCMVLFAPKQTDLESISTSEMVMKTTIATRPPVTFALSETSTTKVKKFEEKKLREIFLQK